MTLDDLWRALALMAIFEGFLYVAMPERMKRMMSVTLSQSADTLRMAGLTIMALGVIALWLLKTT